MTPVTETQPPHVPTFSVSSLPSAPDNWPSYRKRVYTHAVRINGPFQVDTSEGMLRCEDGYLAVDARGYPYPIARDEFDLIYVPVAASFNPDDPDGVLRGRSRRP